MAKKKTIFFCKNCGYEAAKWSGRCQECNEWNTFEEKKKTEYSTQNRERKNNIEKRPLNIYQMSESKLKRFKTNILEFDRVLGGGLVSGGLTLIGGSPGVGKTTLLFNIMDKIAEENKKEKILYISGEESESQLAGRARRIGVAQENLLILNEVIWQNITDTIRKERPKFIVIDSIQTIMSQDISAGPGSISQVREITYELSNLIKARGITCLIIGHITKEGSIAGPKILEHMVDCVIYFEGDQSGQYRILRAIKNRFGNTNEVGIFKMGERGLEEIPNPSQCFIDRSFNESYGRSLTCMMEGTRPLFIETQALTVKNKFGTLRRITQGVDQNRLAVIVAIIEKYFELPLNDNDIYINVVGGIKLSSRESDLSIMVSLLSSYKKNSVGSENIFLGEIGLAGEIRSVPLIEERLKEIEQLNYKRVYISKKSSQKLKGKYKNLDLIGLEKASDLGILFN